MKANNILETIGNTPHVRINRLFGETHEVWMKLERANPGGSIKDRKLKFLRRIPVDPMTGTTEWGMRSYQDDPDSRSWGGQNVFDVYTKSDGVALDGSKYKDW